jgi:hypothetical protein
MIVNNLAFALKELADQHDAEVARIDQAIKDNVEALRLQMIHDKAKEEIAGLEPKFRAAAAKGIRSYIVEYEVEHTRDLNPKYCNQQVPRPSKLVPEELTGVSAIIYNHLINVAGVDVELELIDDRDLDDGFHLWKFRMVAKW